MCWCQNTALGGLLPHFIPLCRGSELFLFKAATLNSVNNFPIKEKVIVGGSSVLSE
jgi:hypothetical protein